MADRWLVWAVLVIAGGWAGCDGGELQDAGPGSGDAARPPIEPPPDAEPPPRDASVPDGSVRDAAPQGSPDASPPDAGSADSGTGAPPLFADGFESGDLSHTENGVEWCCNSVRVSDERARSGRYSLRFAFGPDAPGEDSWAEQRVALGRPMTEVWVSYALYVPPNYAHRSDSPSNNKFFALYHGPDFMSGSAPGWKQITMHIAAESGPEGRDGVIQLWRDGESIIDIRDARNWGGAGTNFFDEAYILGWANSGFTENTVLFVDDVRISETPLAP